MKLGTRFWLAGALMPGVVMLLAFVVAGRAFRVALESSLDRALLAQAAAESVSLFDRADGPHLHMGESPLLEDVRPFAPTGALFDDHGALIAHFPALSQGEPGEVSPPIDGPPRELRTLEGETRTRVLETRVQRDDGARFVLRLSASLAQVDESVRTFDETSLVVVLVATLVLAFLQTLLGRRLSKRLVALSDHLERLKQGRLDAPPEPDAQGDEISALREVLAQTTVQLQRARTAQERLLADAAHELRTPLTLMRTTLDLALRKERSPDELRRALDDARMEVDRLARLASALLDVAAASHAWDAREEDLAKVLDEASEGVRALAEERGVWLEIECERPAHAKVNATAIRQAVDNLLANAFRFAPKNSTVWLTLARHEGGWRIAVRDEGPGIPVEQREAVFAPFHRGDPRGGSGLGLAIVSEVMRQHGGTARAVSPESGTGAWVLLDLPAREVPKSQSHTGKVPAKF